MVTNCGNTWIYNTKGMIQATSPGAGPEVHVSSGAFEEGEPLWLWIAGYDGPPTDYTRNMNPAQCRSRFRNAFLGIR